MKITLLVLLSVFALLTVTAQQGPPIALQEEKVGNVVYGNAQENNDGQSYHYLKIDKIEKKYLFIRLSPLNELQKGKMGIAIYQKGKKELIASCLQDMFDTCYIKRGKLTQNSTLLLVVNCEFDCRYGFYTYWGDLEHLKPNKDFKFTFSEKDPSQLFHLKLQNQTFEHIRIVLKPETYRKPFDNVKMLVKYGLGEEPTSENYDLKSVHVWNEAQAIFINKDEVKGAVGLILLIVGNTKTVYTLRCELIEKIHHELSLNETVYEYVPPKTSMFYHLVLPNEKDIDEYSVKFSVFTGELQVGFFYDKNYSQELMEPQSQYMSDLQFVLKKNQMKKNTKQIYAKIVSTDTLSTYSLTFQGYKSQTAHQISQFVFEFLTIQKRQVLYFYDDFWAQNSEYENLQFSYYTVKMLNMNELPNIEFRKCTAVNLEECTNLKGNGYQSKTVKLVPESISEVGLTKIFKLKLNKSDFSLVNRVAKRILILIVFTNNHKKDVNVAIQYSNDNRIRLLRDDRVIEEKITGSQEKQYKYINNDPTVKQIKVNLNQISGYVQVQAQRKDFRLGNFEPLDINSAQLNIISVKEKITQPVFIKVTGLLNSLYTLSITTAHQKHLYSTSIAISEDVEYKLKLAPGQMINLELNPLFSSIIFDFKAEGGPVSACMVNRANLKCESSPDLNKVLQTEGQIKLVQPNITMKVIRLYNNVNNQNVSLRVIFHSSSFRHCQQRKINQIYDETVKSGQCFRFTSSIPTDIQVSTIREDLGTHQEIFYACSKMIQVTSYKSTNYLSARDIKANCETQSNDIEILMAVLKKNNNTEEFKLQYLLQYRDDVITLKDGIAHRVKGISKEGVVRTFFYNLINTKETEIILMNKKGIQKFFCLITTDEDKYLSSYNAYKSGVNSESSNYYSNPMIKITPEQIQQANCLPNCVFVINVFSREQAGSEIQFSIEVTQDSVVLNEDEIREDFLSDGSVDYYEFKNKKEGESIYATLSVRNNHCAKMFLSDREFPSESNYMKKQNGNQLILNKALKKKYYIAVEGVSDCPYSISISQSKINVTKIRVGQFYDIQLKEGEKKYFILHHISTNSFKVHSLEKFGKVQIYGNETKLSEEVIKGISDGTIKTQDFAFQSHYNNILFVDNQIDNFCSDCYYLLMVVAKQKTQSSIFVGDQSNPIPISKKVLYDEIHKQNYTTVLKTYQISPGIAYVKVFAGSLNISMQYKNQTIENELKYQKQRHEISYNFTKQKNDFSPIFINITGVKVPAIYSFELFVNPDEIKGHGYHLKGGENVYMYLEKGGKQCVNGFINKKDEEIIFSTNNENADKLKRLKISASLDGNEKIQYKTEIVRNVMIFRFSLKVMYINDALPYSICFQSQQKKGLSVVALQGSEVSLLPSDTETIVQNRSKFVIHPQGNFILDLFQCKGDLSVKYATTMKQLSSKPSSRLETVGIAGQNHAVKVSSYATTFVQIESELSTISWMPYNERLERGLGYRNYKVGDFTYETDIFNISFNIGGVQRAKETKTKVVSLVYKLFVSNSKQELQEAVMCQRLTIQNVSKFLIGFYGEESLKKKKIHYQIKKSTISEKFKENETLYFNIVVDMVLTVPIQELNVPQHYRFIYYQQTVPAEVFIKMSLSSLNIFLIIVLILALIIGFIAVGYVFIKWIVPGIGKLKNRMFVEEGVEDQNESIPVPPSSERNQIEQNVGTEEGLN